MVTLISLKGERGEKKKKKEKERKRKTGDKMVELTRKQKKILAVARSKGRVNIQECRLIYSDMKMLKNALSRLCLAGFLKKTESEDFIYNVEQDTTILNYME